ncbi:MAG: hypothetical protein JXA21_12535 [Anaerolineae bacterium]|nr:hypothetical protein [Anaerolineae bacterium]
MQDLGRTWDACAAYPARRCVLPVMPDPRALRLHNLADAPFWPAVSPVKSAMLFLYKPPTMKATSSWAV